MGHIRWETLKMNIEQITLRIAFEKGRHNYAAAAILEATLARLTS